MNNTLHNSTHTDSTSGSTLISGEYYKGICLAFTIIGMIVQSLFTVLAVKKKLMSSLSLSTLLIWASYIPLLISQCLQDISPGFQVAYFFLFGAGSATFLSTQWLKFTKSLNFSSPLKHFIWMIMLATLSFFILFLVLPCTLLLFSTFSIPILNLCSIWTLTFLLQSPVLTLSGSTRLYVYIPMSIMLISYGLLMVGLSLYGGFDTQGIFTNAVVMLIPGIYADVIFGKEKENCGFELGYFGGKSFKGLRGGERSAVESAMRRDSQTSLGSDVCSQYYR